MANDSFNLFVSSFVSFSINGLKENAENLNYYPILRRKVELYLFLQHWSCDKIAKSQNSDKATSFSSVVVNIASSNWSQNWEFKFSAFSFKPLMLKLTKLDTSRLKLSFAMFEDTVNI